MGRQGGPCHHRLRAHLGVELPARSLAGSLADAERVWSLRSIVQLFHIGRLPLPVASAGTAIGFFRNAVSRQSPRVFEDYIGDSLGALSGDVPVPGSRRDRNKRGRTLAFARSTTCRNDSSHTFYSHAWPGEAEFLSPTLARTRSLRLNLLLRVRDWRSLYCLPPGTPVVVQRFFDHGTGCAGQLHHHGVPTPRHSRAGNRAAAPAHNLGKALGVWPLGFGHVRGGMDSELRLHPSGQQFFRNGGGRRTARSHEPGCSGAADLRRTFDVVSAVCGEGAKSEWTKSGNVAQPEAGVFVCRGLSGLLGRSDSPQTAAVSFLIQREIHGVRVLDSIVCTGNHDMEREPGTGDFVAGHGVAAVAVCGQWSRKCGGHRDRNSCHSFLWAARSDLEHDRSNFPVRDGGIHSVRQEDYATEASRYQPSANALRAAGVESQPCPRLL